MADIWPITFDVKNYSFRRNRDGIAWGLIVHPSADCIAVLAAMEPGFDLQITICPAKPGPIESPAGEPQERRTASQAPAGVAKTEGERAVTRAAILVRNERFARWAKTANSDSYLKGYCLINSKRDLATNHDGLRKFLELEAAFRAWAQDNPP